MQFRVCLVAVGSSPLTRGKPWQRPMSLPRPWLIPAHAGKTAWYQAKHSSTRAHPRSRGENAYQSRARDIFKGSSPLTRGKPRRARDRVGQLGLIPAHAGKTPRRGRPRAGTWAHPRSRGENPGEALEAAAGEGSSPLTRGKPCRRRVADGLVRLIPAHAGKTRIHRPDSTGTGAHPRSRGENITYAPAGVRIRGSSPLTQGKRLAALPGKDERGLIPAHAGKTRLMAFSSQENRAHPRSRGENGPSRSIAWARRGSSPLTRGKPWSIRSV